MGVYIKHIMEVFLPDGSWALIQVIRLEDRCHSLLSCLT